MTPRALDAGSFGHYPPQAAQWCIGHIGLLRRLPLVVLPSFLEQAIGYDWKFPVEKLRLSKQGDALAALTSEEFGKLIAPFTGIGLPAALTDFDWVNRPAEFNELLTTHLWSTRRIDQYREAAKVLLDSAPPVPADRPRPRIVIFLAGTELLDSSYELFAKLRPHGLHAVNVARGGEQTWALDILAQNALASDDPYAHWYLDGGEPWALPPGLGRIVALSYSLLAPVRRAVLSRMDRATHTGSGPELLHHQLAAMRPEDCGVQAIIEDPVLQHFAVELFTLGSGTQIYSTSFVQWAAREILRRAQPQTLLVRARPRARQRNLNEAIASQGEEPELDPAGSVIDADMAAYYTWMELQKLPGAEHAIFLTWFQGRGEALLIAPSVPRNVTTVNRMAINDVFSLIGLKP